MTHTQYIVEMRSIKKLSYDTAISVYRGISGVIGVRHSQLLCGPS